MEIRDATQADLPSILAVYNDAVLHTTAIWNETPVDLENRRAWFVERRGRGYPVLVAVEGDEVVGYASFGDWRAFEGYRHTVEHSVYVHRDRRGAGIGESLLRVLMPRAAALGKHIIIAGIEAGNAPSLRLHARLGFVETARMPEVGRKFGRWLDLIFMQKTLDPPDSGD